MQAGPQGPNQDPLVLFALTIIPFFFSDGRVTLQLDGAEETVLELADFLQFATGCRAIPPEGFPNKLGIWFDHAFPQRKISANTCAETITIPVNQKMGSQDTLAAEFIESIINGQGFGKV